MTLPPYSRRREEELRRQQEEGEVRRKLLAAEISQPELPVVTESSAASGNDSGTLESKMKQLRKSYFLKGMGVGALAGSAGGATAGYYMAKQPLAQNLPNFQHLQESPHLRESFNYGYAALGGFLCLVLGVSIGTLIGIAYERRETRSVEKQNQTRE